MSRVAVIGAGAVGCYYGARLAEAGHEVHFLLRSDYDAVAAGGLHIESVTGKENPFGSEGWRCVSYCCPYCNTVLGVQIDPVALKADTINELVAALRR